MNSIASNLFRFVIFIALQVFIFNYVHLFGFINPQVYILPLLLLPLEMKKTFQYLIAFFTGFFIDMFFQTYGIHSLACLLLIYFKPIWVSIITGVRSSDEIFKPLPGEKDFKWILAYVGGLVFLHQLTITMLETFNMREILMILWVSLATALVTTILIVSILYIFFYSKK